MLSLARTGRRMGGVLPCGPADGASSGCASTASGPGVLAVGVRDRLQIVHVEDGIRRRGGIIARHSPGRCTGALLRAHSSLRSPTLAQHSSMGSLCRAYLKNGREASATSPSPLARTLYLRIRPSRRPRRRAWRRGASGPTPCSRRSAAAARASSTSPRTRASRGGRQHLERHAPRCSCRRTAASGCAAYAGIRTGVIMAKDEAQ